MQKRKSTVSLVIEIPLKNWNKAYPELNAAKKTCKCGKKLSKKPKYRFTKTFAVLDFGNCTCGKKALFRQRLGEFAE